MATVHGDARYERRIVSILFADLVGFTPLAERFDPEDVAAIQDRYFAAVRDAVARYRGVVEKFIGDAAMAAFGVPTARDDDAERAVRCGLAIAAAVERLHGEVGLDPGELAVRVGIATGEVVHAEGGPDAGRLTGDTVNTAARLQTAARPGGVLLSEATALAVADAIELGPAVELELKGKRSTVRARAALGARPVRSREAAMGDLRAPTLGRGTELAILATALARTASRATTERWLVVAPPGTGKTRLLDELTDHVPPSTAVRRVRFRADDPRPFGGLSDLAAQLVDADLEARLGQAGLSVGRSRVVAEALDALAGGSVAERTGAFDREARFAAWRDGLAALAPATGELWLVEDAHWAGRDALAFLDAAETRPGPGGRLVVVTSRPSLLEAERAWSAAGAERGHHRIDLLGLPGDASVELIRALVGDAVGKDLAARIADASDGNCLFIEELLRTWISVGILRRDGRGWRLVAADDPVAIPLTVSAVYGAQLDDLPSAARTVARRAAVAGRRFPVGALVDLGVDDADGAVEGLVRRRLIDGPLELVVVGDGYAYRHALLRDAAYGSLARSERATLHVALARWLETAAGDRVDEVAESIAEHYEAAVASAPALSPAVAPDLDRGSAASLAAGWLERAGIRMATGAAVDGAAGLLRRALALTPEDAPMESARRWLELGRTLRRAGHADRAIEAFERAIEQARSARRSSVPSERATARSWIAEAGAELARLAFEQIRFVDAWHLADAILDEIGPTDDVETARLLLARAAGRGGETNEAGPWIADSEAALAIARITGDRHLELAALDELASARDEAGDLTIDDLRVIGTLARELGDWDAAASATIGESGFLLVERPADVPAALAPARELAEAWLLSERLGWILQRTSEAQFATGDWDRGIATGLEAVELGESRGLHRVVVRTLTSLLVMGGRRGDRDLVDRGHAWYQAAERRILPDSPYGRVLYANASIWFGRYGLGHPVVPDPTRLRDGLAQEPSGPAWVGAVATILETWRSAGWIEPVREAVQAWSAALDRSAIPNDLARGALAVESAALAVSADAGPAEVEAIVRRGLPILRSVGAGWWLARAVRLLEAAGAATELELTEAAGLERMMGLPGPA